MIQITPRPLSALDCQETPGPDLSALARAHFHTANDLVDGFHRAQRPFRDILRHLDKTGKVRPLMKGRRADWLGWIFRVVGLRGLPDMTALQSQCPKDQGRLLL